MNVKHYVRALLCLYFSLLISIQSIKAQSLKVGDSLPPELWSMPLQVINHPQGKETITLSEYKDKLIILDFWATWCSPCIKSLTKLDTLQKEFGERLAVIPITYENADKVLPFVTKRGYQLPSVINDSTLKKHFPHRSIPHQVWVRAGEVLAVTGAEYATRENISKTLNKEKVQMLMKEEDMEFDASKPLLVDGNGGGMERLLYQSVFSKRINARVGGWKFSKNGYAIYNCDLRLHLFNAFSEHITWSSRYNRITFEVDSVTISKLDYQSAVVKKDLREDEVRSWLEDYTYCYSLTLPVDTDKKTIRSIVQEHLLQFMRQTYSLDATLRCRKMLSYVLSVNDAYKYVKPVEKVGYKTASMQSFFDNLAYINALNELPFELAIDADVAASRALSYPEDLDFTNLEAVGIFLEDNGLLLRKDEVELTVLVVSPLNEIKI